MMTPSASPSMSVQGAHGQPLEYPVPLCVRNTFIDCSLRPLSLDEFFTERQVASCPTSMVADISDGSMELPKQPALNRSKTAGHVPSQGAETETRSQDGQSECSTADTAETEATAAPDQASESSDKEKATEAGRDVIVLRLSDAVKAPSPSWRDVAAGVKTSAPVAPPSAPLAVAQDLPSMGSSLHGTGECKPCAFLHSKGCKSGLNCQFCHLCEPGEKKKRQKEKRAFFSSIRNIRQIMGGAFNSR